MPDQLQQLDALLAHEEMELLAREIAPRVQQRWREHFMAQRRTIAGVRSWIAELAAGARPGGDGYSRGANHFHEHGELLPVPGEEEVRSAVAAQIGGNHVANGKFYAVQ